MTRKDFVLLSDTLRGQRPDPVPGDIRDAKAEQVAMLTWEVICGQIALAIAKDHTGFDSQRFMVDCGVQP